MSDYETALASADDATEATRLYRHKAYRRFRVGRFEFRDNFLRIRESEADEFLSILQDPKFPRSELVNIVEVDEDAARAAESSIFARDDNTVRGAMTASDIKTAKDAQATGAPQSKPEQQGGALNPNPSGPGAAFTGLTR